METVLDEVSSCTHILEFAFYICKQRIKLTLVFFSLPHYILSLFSILPFLAHFPAAFGNTRRSPLQTPFVESLNSFENTNRWQFFVLKTFELANTKLIFSRRCQVRSKTPRKVLLEAINRKKVNFPSYDIGMWTCCSEHNVSNFTFGTGGIIEKQEHELTNLAEVCLLW